MTHGKRFLISQEKRERGEREGERGGGWRVLQIFQNNFRSPRDHRPKYFMAQ